jgi:hypothetical protein
VAAVQSGCFALEWSVSFSVLFRCQLFPLHSESQLSCTLAQYARQPKQRSQKKMKTFSENAAPYNRKISSETCRAWTVEQCLANTAVRHRRRRGNDCADGSRSDASRSPVAGAGSIMHTQAEPL